MVITMNKHKLFNADCLEILPTLPDHSVDFILADPPYGITPCHWDSLIPLEPLWEQLKRVIKLDGAIALFGSQPFTSTLITSNIKMFRYSWVWEKEKGSCPMLAPYRPHKVHEDIVIFSPSAAAYSKRGEMCYYPQMTAGAPRKARTHKSGKMKYGSALFTLGNNGTRYPKSVLRYNTERGLHATQKPVSLLEYLIDTYTQAGDLVLDFTMGSGSTGVACENKGREFIGIEKDLDVYTGAVERINGVKLSTKLSTDLFGEAFGG